VTDTLLGSVPDEGIEVKLDMLTLLRFVSVDRFGISDFRSGGPPWVGDSDNVLGSWYPELSELSREWHIVRTVCKNGQLQRDRGNKSSWAAILFVPH